MVGFLVGMAVSGAAWGVAEAAVRHILEEQARLRREGKR